ncbi:MAG TPA: flagella basal body P-ring formation protein FlgA [Bryobacteraceae bacterium]|nr:flagella basal body P-ring formation protein FlgA [Bryobacteraceae bacterium]
MKWAFYLVLAFSVCSNAGDCQIVHGDRILAGDLAAAVPAFAKLDPATELAPSPLPGLRRVFHIEDLARLARMHGMDPPAAPAQVCVERAAEPSAEHKPRAAARPARLSPPVIDRGDQVAVKVFSGSVLLSFHAEAESAGRPGQRIIVRNPLNGRRFLARVEDRGKVVVRK